MRLVQNDWRLNNPSHDKAKTDDVRIFATNVGRKGESLQVVVGVHATNTVSMRIVWEFCAHLTACARWSIDLGCAIKGSSD